MYQEEINKATVIDSFDKTKMDLIADSVKLYPATVTLAGTTTTDYSNPISADDYTVQSNEGGFSVSFDNPILSAYTLVYDTKIIGEKISNTEYKNHASFQGEKVTPASAEALFQASFANSLEKTGIGYQSIQNSQLSANTVAILKDEEDWMAELNQEQ